MAATSVIVYGDSIMKATTTDDRMRPKFNIKDYVERLWRECGVQIIDRARFGATILKGYKNLQADLGKGIEGAYALLEYGGNDCDYDWKAISEDPCGTHLPRTSLPEYISTLETMVEKLQRSNIKPVLMTLPPIDSDRYFQFIVKKGLNSDNILSWLGDTQMIYRFHELYSNAIVRFSEKKKLPLVDVRSKFLDKHNFKELISEDGIHPSLQGYELMYDTVKDYIKLNS